MSEKAGQPLISGHVKSRSVGTRVTSVLTLVGFTLAQMPLAVQAQTTPNQVLTRAEYEACQSTDESAFRGAIETLTLKGLNVGLANVDYRALVGTEWRKSNMAEVIDKQVDASVNEVSDENGYWAKATSLWNSDKSKELANSVAERVFKSESIKKSLEALAGGVGMSLGKRIELASSDTAEPAMQCLQAFLGPRYGSTIARIVSADAGKEFRIDPDKAQGGVSAGQVLTEHAGGVAGAIILIVRRQLVNMAERVGARIVGSVLARLVGTIAGGIGAVLIAKDIWDFRNGVLPIIASEMKSQDTKDKIQDELSRSMKEQIGDNLKDIASKTADRVVDVWRDFRRAHAKVLELAEKNADFKKFLENLKPEALPRLDEIVALLLGTEGEAGIIRRLGDGSLNTAVNVMPPAAFEIAREQKSIETALAWSTLAGPRLPLIVEGEIYKRTKPQNFTAASLNQLLDVGDKVAIQKLASLDPPVRATLFEAAAPELKNLGRALTEPELVALARYLTGLEKIASGRILRAVAQTPSRMQLLAQDGVRDGILASKDQGAAVGMMLAADSAIPDPYLIIQHAQLVLDGKVAPRLMWEKHPAISVSLGVLVVVILSMLKRLIFGRRQKVIVKQVAVPASAIAPPIKSRKS